MNRLKGKPLKPPRRISKLPYEDRQAIQSETGCKYVFGLSHSDSLAVPLRVVDWLTTDGFFLGEKNMALPSEIFVVPCIQIIFFFNSMLT